MASSGLPSGREHSGEASRRQEILAIAAKLFAATGFSGTSLSDVAEAAGILPGSLYHHFDSKEALAVELVHGFQDDLRRAALNFIPAADSTEALREFSRAMTAITYRHQAAVQLCVYDAPTSVGTRFREAVAHRPPAVRRRWRELVERAEVDGSLRGEVDGQLLRYVFNRGAASVGLLPLPHIRPVDWSDYLTAVMLDGLSLDCPPVEELDRSAARGAAREAIAGWHANAQARGRTRREQILDVARREFARRGFEATTMRDVAEAAETRASSLYRHFDSKATMLNEIVERFSHQLYGGFRDVATAGGSATETLDGLIDLMVHAGRTFRYEFDILSAWWQLADHASPDGAFDEIRARFTLLRDLLDQGARAGELRSIGDDVELLSMCVRDVLWMPRWGTNRVTPARARQFLRETVLTGARSTV